VQRREGEHICQRVALTDGAEPLQKRCWLACQAFLSFWISSMPWNIFGRQAQPFMEKPTQPARPWVETQALQLLSSHTLSVIQELEGKADSLTHNSQAARSCAE